MIFFDFSEDICVIDMSSGLTTDISATAIEHEAAR